MPITTLPSAIAEAANADLAQAAAQRVCIIHVHGRRALPPRLAGIWTFYLPWEALATEFNRHGVLRWLSAHHGEDFSMILDLCASHPCGARIEWERARSASAWLDSDVTQMGY